MRKTAYLLVVVVLLLAAPVFAQGPFNDVPTDHWAYDAVNKLQKDGIVIGYPDGTFGGKRAMSRYEFATAIARMLPLIGGQDLSSYATKSELQNAIAGIKIPEMPDLSTYATKADVDAIKKLVDEFRDEIAALGVDVDALKRDVAALSARVDAIEAEMKRVRFTGDVNIFGIATSAQKGDPIDVDQRNLNGAAVSETKNNDTLLRNVGVVKDFDLNIVGRVSQTTTAVATINYGDYLNYLGFVDDYVGGHRATSTSSVSSPLISGASTSLSDAFFPYYLYINTGLCGKGSLTMGRFPLQWTPYTLKKIDVDSYTSILKTDDGNYPVDGIKAAYNFGGVDVTLFAAKNDENNYLVNGLTGQPTLADGNFTTNDIGGHSVGGLTTQITQSAGGRVTFGTPWKGVIGLTYYQAWSEGAWAGLSSQDQAQVYGADLNIPFGKFGFVGSWTKSNALKNDRVAGARDITDDNVAWDGKLTATFGKLGIGAGYKSIGRNFTAAGAWDKIGRWTNPSDVKGPYVDITIPIARKLKLALNGEMLTAIDNLSGLPIGTNDSQVTKAEAGVKWGMSNTNSMVLGYEWVKWNPSMARIHTGTESYLTLGWAHQMSANAGFKVGYQFVNWDGGRNLIPYAPATDYKGGVAVAQFGVSF
jgi:hypothetical protein